MSIPDALIAARLTISWLVPSILGAEHSKPLLLSVDDSGLSCELSARDGGRTPALARGAKVGGGPVSTCAGR